MDWLQTFSLVFVLPALAIAAHELTHLAVGRIACPFSVKHISWIPFRLQLDFSRMPSKATLRVIGLAPLLVGSVAAAVAIQAGIWQQIKTVDPYYLHHLAVAYWLLYIAPSPADLRLALCPRLERMDDVQPSPQ